MAKKWIIISCLLISWVVGKGQEESMKEENKAAFKLGVFYNSDLNYYGRTDSLRSSAYFPIAEISFGTGVYISAAPIFINNNTASMKYAGTVATLGYRYDQPGKLGAHVYIVKPFYEPNTQLVQSAMKGQFAASFSIRNKVINLNVGGDIKLSDQLDYGLSAGLDHLFRKQLSSQWILVIVPSAYIYAGTQRFTKTYYKENNFLLFPGTSEKISKQVNQFAILAYEFSAPVVIGKGKFHFIANPAYVIPQNLVQVPDQPGLSEKGQEMFYFTLGLQARF
jgi:hypothetical protein